MPADKPLARYQLSARAFLNLTTIINRVQDGKENAQRVLDFIRATFLSVGCQVPETFAYDLENDWLSIYDYPAMSTPTPLSPKRLEEIQALRDHVRDNLLQTVQGDRHNYYARYFRLEDLLDEGDELQRELARRPSPETVAAHRRTIAYATAAGFGIGVLKALQYTNLPPDARQTVTAAIAELQQQLDNVA